MHSHWAKAHGGRAVRPWVSEATPPYPYVSPIWCPHVFLTLILYQIWVRNLITQLKNIKRVRF